MNASGEVPVSTEYKQRPQWGLGAQVSQGQGRLVCGVQSVRGSQDRKEAQTTGLNVQRAEGSEQELSPGLCLGLSVCSTALCTWGNRQARQEAGAPVPAG